LIEGLGRGTASSVQAFGFGAHLFFQSLYWVLMGRRVHQTVRAEPIFSQMMVIGVRAIPIVSMLSVAIGITLSMQGIDSLKQFGAQHQVIFMVALSVTREFGPLITGILVAGRSGSALAARISTMTINQEVDALKVMGINPVRYIVVPSLIGMMIVLPALTLWSVCVALIGSAIFVTPQLGTTMGAFLTQVNAWSGRYRSRPDQELDLLRTDHHRGRSQWNLGQRRRRRRRPCHHIGSRARNFCDRGHRYDLRIRGNGLK
jgi:phospholipid/cholesterol/gamma-HCH transport system permease protein